MLVLGQKKEPQKIVLREAVPERAAVKKRVKNKVITVAAAVAAEPEAFVIMAPITKPMRRRAMAAARRVTGPIEDIADVSPDVLLDAADAASRELIRLGMVDWGGIGGADGKPFDLTPDRDTRLKTANDPERPTGTIDLLLDDVDLLDKIEAEYSRPDNARQAEKNASSASPSGTGGAATLAKTIAASPANRRARRAAAKNARTAKTPSKAKRAKGSGTR